MKQQKTTQGIFKLYLSVSGLWTALSNIDYGTISLLAYTVLAALSVALAVDSLNSDLLPESAESGWTCRQRHFILLGMAGAQMSLLYDSVIAYRFEIETLRYAFDGILAACVAVGDMKHRLRSHGDAEQGRSSTDSAT